MTETEFIEAHILNILNREFTINFNFNPIRGTGGPFVAESLVIPIYPKKYNQQTYASEKVSLKSVLEQVTSIKIVTVDNNIPSQEVVLEVDVVGKRYYQQGELYDPFYYFQIEPITLPNSIINTAHTTSTAEQNDIRETNPTVFQPFIINLQFGFNEYNAVISNAINNRDSNIRQQSDRNVTTIGPANLEAILSGSATFAQIQDSLYYNTGWNNARYTGTKTSESTYSNIPATINGSSFKGQEYSREVRSGSICLVDRSDRIIKDYLFAGISETPSVEYIVENGTEVTTTTSGPITADRTDNVINLNSSTIKYRVDQILEIVDPSKTINNTYQPEIIRVLDVTYDGSGIATNLTVIRGAVETAVYAHGTGSEIRKISDKSFVFKFQENQTAIEKITNRKVWVSEKNNVILVGKEGTVVKVYDCS